MDALEAVDYTSPDAAEKFAASLNQTGFGVLKNHPLPESTVQNIYNHWQVFFDSEEKNNFTFDAINYDGFFPMEMAEAAKGHKTRDLKEYYHFYLWGQCPAHLKQELTAYYNDTVTFAGTLLSWAEQYLPQNIRDNLSEPLTTMMTGSTQSLLRILHYPPLEDETEPDAIRANAHEDINLLTVLPASNEPGLQVKTKENTWLEVPCDFGNLIINSGDMLQEATAGYYPSTTHRVVNPVDANRKKSRISLPLFLHPRSEVALSNRYTAGNYLEERLRELRDTN